MPLAFFGTFFRVERKYYPLGAAAPPSAPESARHPPGEGSLTDKLAYIDACRGFPLAPCPLRFARRSKRTPHKNGKSRFRAKECVLT